MILKCGRREWQVYKNIDGITTTMRTHLKLRHSREYERVVSLLKLKHSSEVDHPMPVASSSGGPFNLDEWIRLMIRWIVTDDRVRLAIIFQYQELNIFFSIFNL
jgi:hypothetical protein